MRSRTILQTASVSSLTIVALLALFGIGAWLIGLNFGRKTYQIIAEFPDAGGVLEGGTVRFRGVQVGRIRRIEPGSNGVDVVMEIASTELLIPNQVRIESNRSGFLGEASIDIIPLAEVPQNAKSLNPLSSECDSDVIICNNDRLTGRIGIDPFTSFAKLSDLYTNPEFYARINLALENLAIATKEIAELSNDLSLLTNTAQKDLKVYADTARSITRTVDNLSTRLDTTSEQFNLTAKEIATLATNVNQLITENRTSLNETLTSIGNASDELGTLATNLQFTVTKVNTSLEATDTTQLLKNLEIVTANLRDISNNINSPANLLTLQQTLDSARVTFANTQKITSDIDELTGDPEFRDNVRKLVNGLSNLVSYTEQLEQQIKTAQALESLSEQLKASPMKE